MFSKQRVEALSDGIFAIVLTLLVIEIRVPHLESGFTESGLLHGLQDLIPLFLSFFLSFAVLTSYWVNHHFLISIFAKTINRQLAYINFLFLAFVSLIPFSSHLLGEYPESQIAIAFYSIHILLMGLILFIIREYIISEPKIENPDFSEINITNKDRLYGSARIFLSVAASILAVIFSFINTYVSIIFLIVPVIYGVIPGLLGFTLRITRVENLLEKTKL